MIICDGAYGTQLNRSSDSEASVDELVLREPERVRDLHLAYIEAGATRIHTPTLTTFLRSGAQRATVYREAWSLCSEAAATAAGDADVEPVLVIGPGFSDARDYWTDIEHLLELGVTSVACITAYRRDVALAFAQAWHDVAGSSGITVRATLSLSVTPDGRAERWAWIRDVAKAMSARQQHECVELGLNCCAGLDGIEQPLQALADAWPSPLHLAPSAGLPGSAPMSPESWAAGVMSLTERVEVGSVGGCCGTSPEWIEQLAGAAAS